MTLDYEEKSLATNIHSRNQAADECYKTLFEQVNAAAFLTTLDGQFLEMNHRRCDL
jgi:PAS domain-containing protein